MIRLLLVLCCSLLCNSVFAKKPNILWISTEDIGPHLGAYGDSYAINSNTSPNLDEFAQQSFVFTKASSNAPVCAVARTTLISGMYATSTGGQHMRSRVPAPQIMKFFPYYLQQAGYYTTNNSKTDYNLVLSEDKIGWHESSKNAHWKNAPKDKPFFAIFNYTKTHESQIRNQNPKPHHEPDKVVVPPYHPDTPEARKDWAQYYDRIKTVDQLFAERMQELKRAGKAEDTIVFFWGDHGSGMPRSKRFAGWSGVHVPLIIHVPEKYKHLAPNLYKAGGRTDQLVGFIDFAPSMLSIAGVEIPSYYQGKAFMGAEKAKPQKYLYTIRSRMDSANDESRGIIDGKFSYMRNFLPHLPHGQYLPYQQETPTTKQWMELFLKEKTTEAQSHFWRTKELEELYDLENDPYEINNLAKDPRYANKIGELRAELYRRIRGSKDLLYWPEPIMRRLIKQGKSPMDVYRDLHKNSVKWPSNSLMELDRSKIMSLYEYSKMPLEEKYWQLQLIHSQKTPFTKVSSILNDAINDKEGLIKVVAAEYIAANTPSTKQRSQAYQVIKSIAEAKETDFTLRVFCIRIINRLAEQGFALPDSLIDLDVMQYAKQEKWGASYIPRMMERVQQFKRVERL